MTTPSDDPRRRVTLLQHVRFEERVLFEAVPADVGPAGLVALGRALLERRAARGLAPGLAPRCRSGG